MTFKINLYAQWLSKYVYNRDTYATPSGNINAVPEIIKLMRAVAISINAPSGNINIVPINLTYMLSDNLNTCAINKYTNTLRGDDNRTAATW